MREGHYMLTITSNAFDYTDRMICSKSLIVSLLWMNRRHSFSFYQCWVHKFSGFMAIINAGGNQAMHSFSLASCTHTKSLHCVLTLLTYNSTCHANLINILSHLSIWHNSFSLSHFLAWIGGSDWYVFSLKNNEWQK